MPYVKAQDRCQMMMCSLDSMVAPESIARIIDVFVESLDLKGMDFQKTETAREGRPKYPIAALLKLYIYGQQKMIRSSRKLAEACRVNIEVKWLMEGLEPDFRTIANFRRDNISCMKKVFHEFNRRLADSLEKGYLSVDGSKFQANNSKDNNFTAGKLDDRILWLNQHVEEYLRQIEVLDLADEEVSGTFTREELDEKLKKAQERLERYQRYRSYMEENGLAQMSLVDADAKLMKSRNGFTVAYNVQTAVDSETHMIEDYQVTDQVTDHGLIESTAADEKERRGKIVEVVADKGYQKEEDMARCLENGIIPHVVLPDGKDSYEVELPYEEAEITQEKLESTDPEVLKECLHAGYIPDAYKDVLKDVQVVEKRKFIRDETDETQKSPYGTAEEMISRAKEGYFVRDPERNLVYCPAGETLRQKSIKKNGNIRYANKTACRHCAFRNKCYKGKNDFKEVDFNKDTLEKPNRNWLACEEKKADPARSAPGHYERYKAVVVRLFPDREKMSRRLCLSEHPFGTIKRAMNAGYFLLRGKEKVDGETALMCLGYNLKRALGLLGFEKMMEAMA